MQTLEISASQLIKQLSNRLKLKPVEVPGNRHDIEYTPTRRNLVERHLSEHLVKVQFGNGVSGYIHTSSDPGIGPSDNFDLYELLDSIVGARMRDIVKLYNKVTQDWSGKHSSPNLLFISEEGRQILIDDIAASEFYIYPQTEKERLENEGKKGKQQYVAENSQVARAIYELQQRGRTNLSLVSKYLPET